MDVEPLRQLSRDLGIDSRVDWMLRPIAESEVPALFRSADAVVLPYREIDQSGVLMTAIAFGKPVLATRVGGIPEIIQDGVHGYLVEAEDVAALAHAADCLLSCKERRLEMESAVRALCKGSLGWSSIASKTLDLYRHVLEPRSSAEVVKSNTRFAHQRIGF
jgi:glycosyltransferase involved in cell wall biosynthesis